MSKPINFQDKALEACSLAFAKFLGIDNIPIVWNVNPYRLPKKEGTAPKHYPIMYMRIDNVRKSEFAGKRKHSNQYSLGSSTEDGTSRKAIYLTPGTFDLSFMIITDNPNDAVDFATKLIVYNETFNKHALLGFAISIPKLGRNFAITNQIVITSEQYDIQPVEFDESAPMEYNIVGTMQLHTRLTVGGLDPALLSTFAVYRNVDPDSAVTNEDGSFSGLVRDDDLTARVFPIAMRNDQGL